MNSLLNYAGYEYKAVIRGDLLTGKIQVEGCNVFLCQDLVNGYGCKDRLGYRYSYFVNMGTQDDLRRYNINYFLIHKNETWEIY